MRMPSPRLKETKGKSGKWSRSHKRWGKRFHGKKKHVENEVSVGVCLCIVCVLCVGDGGGGDGDGGDGDGYVRGLLCVILCAPV